MPESLPPEVRATKARLDRFVEEELLPLERSLEGPPEATVPVDVRRRVRAASKAAGFWEAQRRRRGEGGTSALELTVIRETLAKHNLRVSQYMFGPGPGLLASAEGRLREEYTDKVLAGEKSGAFGFTEPDDIDRSQQTRAVLSADGSTLSVTGQKSYVTGGAAADFVAVLANVKESDGRTARGTAMVVVDRDSPGVTIEREFTSMDGGPSHAFMRFKDVQVPAWHVVGKLGEGLPRALGQIGNVRLALAAECVGLSMWAVELVEEHLRAPHRSGSPLGAREGVRLRLADLRIEVFAARATLYRAARLVDSGEDAVQEVAATKIYATEVAGRVADAAVQLVGGNALVRGHPLEHLYRRVRSARLTEGASDLLRINLAEARLSRRRGRL